MVASSPAVVDVSDLFECGPPPLARPDPFAHLNAEQRSAVEHGGPGGFHAPLLVLAGAGSGKTMTLAARVARLVIDGADPNRILLLTFSRRAALEMERRVGRTLHQALGMAPTSRAPSLRWCGTFHAMGARLLREHASRIGLSEAFTIDDRADSEDLIDLLRHELALGEQKRRFPQKGTCLAIYSRVVNARMTLADALRDVFPWCGMWHDELKQLFGNYAREKQGQHVLDYDDLLLYWWQMLDEPVLAAEIGARFDHVIVDEYQDTNRLQAAILQRLKPDGRGLTVVGDDAQSIYSFRGAEVRNILDFASRFASPARVVMLERNYRSTMPILAASNGVIGEADRRHAKRLWTEPDPAASKPLLVHVADEAEQACWVAGRALALRESGLALRSQAVLFRTTHHSAPLELELARRGIPFVKFGGLKFLDSAHVKDALAVLRWASNPRSKSAGLRVAQRVQGIGPASARRLLAEMESAADASAALLAFKPPPGAAEPWRVFCELFGSLQSNGSAWPDELKTVHAWLVPQLARLHDDAREADLAQLAQMARGTPSRLQFLTDMTLDPPVASSDESGEPMRDEDYLILSTIHSAKGLEWSAVTVLNVVDGCMPSDMATGTAADIDEERRLLYVGMTRARHHLHLMVPQRFYVHGQAAYGDRHVYATLSRFMPASLHELFETVVATSPRAPASGALPWSGPGSDVGSRVAGLWS